MSARRFIVIATVVIVAVLCVPAALVPVLNGADLIVIAAPLVVVALWVWRRRPKSPAGGNSPTDAPIVDAPPAGSLR